MDKLNNETCEVIKRELKKASLSYRDLSENMGVSEVSIKRMLNGHQSLSILRVSEISEIIQVSLSSIIAEAEKNIASVPLFTKEQDIAFTKSPELYTLLYSILSEKMNSKQLMNFYDLNESSMYLYLRELEKLDLISIISNLTFKLIVPRHIAFPDTSRFQIYYKNHVIDGLKRRVEYVNPLKKDAYFITSKLRLTEEEFFEYNLKLEELMMNALKLSQTRNSSVGDTFEYTIVDMGAKGAYHPELKRPENLV